MPQNQQAAGPAAAAQSPLFSLGRGQPNPLHYGDRDRQPARTTQRRRLSPWLLWCSGDHACLTGISPQGKSAAHPPPAPEPAPSWAGSAPTRQAPIHPGPWASGFSPGAVSAPDLARYSGQSIFRQRRRSFVSGALSRCKQSPHPRHSRRALRVPICASWRPSRGHAFRILKWSRFQTQSPALTRSRPVLSCRWDRLAISGPGCCHLVIWDLMTLIGLFPTNTGILISYYFLEFLW